MQSTSIVGLDEVTGVAQGAATVLAGSLVIATGLAAASAGLSGSASADSYRVTVESAKLPTRSTLEEKRKEASALGSNKKNIG